MTCRTRFLLAVLDEALYSSYEAQRLRGATPDRLARSEIYGDVARLEKRYQDEHAKDAHAD